MIRWSSLLLVLIAGMADAETPRLPRADNVPGGISILPLPDTNGSPPRAYLGKERVMVVRHNNRWQAIIGVPLLWEGETRLTVIATEPPEMTYELAIRPKDYGAQHIRLKNQRLVTPNPDDLQRIEREQREIQAAFAHWRDTDTPDMRFDLPARGRLSGNFGQRRFFNDEPRQPHSGVDIAAPLGTAVIAPAEAVVLHTGDYFFNGRTVFLDHGQGLISMYTHLHKIDVTTGTAVKRGQKIGEIGASGRATGAHLHWSASLNGARVDPLLFVAKETLTSLAPGKAGNRRRR